MNEMLLFAIKNESGITSFIAIFVFVSLLLSSRFLPYYLHTEQKYTDKFSDCERTNK